MMIKVMIVEDHPMVVEGLKLTVSGQGDFELCGIANNASDAMSLAETTIPDVIIMDIRLPDQSGIDLCKAIMKKLPDVSVLALTSHHQPYFVKSMLDAGAKGYLLKSELPDDICSAIRCVFQGKEYLSPDVKMLLETYCSQNIFISRREKEVLKLIAEGMTNMEIAEKLFLSPLTVDSHRKNIISKLV
jgi:DNA-binding NarL/FixJ family response regulator